MSQRIVFTDLDGTLLNNDSELSSRNRATLLELKQKDVLRVVVTGRSLYSAKLVLADDFPIDYLVFSTGSGIYDWKDHKLLYANDIPQDLARSCTEILLETEANFMLHRPIPESHYFVYHYGNHIPDDFELRMQLYQGYSEPFNAGEHLNSPASQFLSMFNSELFEDFYQLITKKLSKLSLIKTTSPLHTDSIWLEIYATNVNKASGALKLIELLKIEDYDAMAIGNDFNDSELLEYFTNSYVVANAPMSLRTIYRNVASNSDDGFSEAVTHWLKS